jgi:tyrosyl-tRNA synthetase
LSLPPGGRHSGFRSHLTAPYHRRRREDGKTERGAVWLNADQLAPYDYWQFWRNTQDADVGRFLRLFTDMPLEEIARLEALQGSDINEAKKLLADAATALLHGEEAARDAAETARRTFEEGAAGESLPTLSVPSGEIGLVDALLGLGLAASKGEARRLIAGGGARIGGEKADEDVVIPVSEPLRISAARRSTAC